jgi:hypothetical protein
LWVVTSLLQLIPALLAAWLVGRDLLARAGPARQAHLRRTGARQRRRDLPGFLRRLCLGLFSPGLAS